MRIRAIIFDRDGVLTTFDAAAAADFFRPLLPLSIGELAVRWQEWGAIHGFPRSLAEENRFFHGFWHHLATQFQLAPESRMRLAALKYTDFMQPFSDARPALIVARQHNCQTGVLSNFSLASLEASLHAVGLGDLVDAACAATVIGASKPDPAAYQAVTQALDVRPDECIFLDDELPCVEGARGVGMRAWLVDRQRSEHAIDEGVICDLTALADLLVRA